MKKPAKKELKYKGIGTTNFRNTNENYNQAIDEMDAYYQELIKSEYVKKSELPDTNIINKCCDEIIRLIKKLEANNTRRNQDIKANYIKKSDLPSRVEIQKLLEGENFDWFKFDTEHKGFLCNRLAIAIHKKLEGK